LSEIPFQPTPPRGRRRKRTLMRPLRDAVSTHASAREATVGLLIIPIRQQAFQPTPPRGRRLASASGRPPCAAVSTHASAREATAWYAARATVTLPFQPTPPRGRRRPLPILAPPPNSFNPRLRAGGDAVLNTYFTAASTRFNPRLRAGGDSRGRCAASTRTRFQPTPPRGRRRYDPWRGGLGEEVSTHASAREATRGSRNPRGGIQVSTHASAREATRPVLRGWPPGAVSTHASAREATRVLASDSPTKLPFQPTPPRGRRPRAGAHRP